MEITEEMTIDRLRYNMHRPERKTIFVIGAGASNEVASLPLGSELAKALLDQWGYTDCGAFQRILDDIAIKYNFNKNDVKTILFALNSIDSGRLVSDVCRSLTVSDEPHSPFYNQVSHSFLEGKIDAILNFNFDTLLDNALASDYFGRDYRRIIFDVEAATNVFYIDGKPLYIKPHGSIDYKESLRFQRADFYDVGKNMSELIGRLVAENPTNIVTIGFRAKFYEFTDILEEKMCTDSEIFIVDKVEDVLDANLLPFYHGGFVQINDSYLLTDFMNQLMR